MNWYVVRPCGRAVRKRSIPTLPPTVYTVQTMFGRKDGLDFLADGIVVMSVSRLEGMLL